MPRTETADSSETSPEYIGMLTITQNVRFKSEVLLISHPMKQITKKMIKSLKKKGNKFPTLFLSLLFAVVVKIRLFNTVTGAIESVICYPISSPT
jgi:hypothetical protein